jgi:RNA 2',3'-cyclic 3'-phosphodiesterase
VVGKEARVVRLFVAADVPAAAREALAAEQKRITALLIRNEREPFGRPGPHEREPFSGPRPKEREPFRRAGTLKWVNPEHSHLTLVFLGDVDDARVPAVVEAIGRDVALEPFQITLESIGVFPPRGAPRVLWIGVGAGASLVADLQREIARRVAALGIALEDRPFHPHLTLARWRDSRPADRGRALDAAPRGVVARARIDGATLYQSRLSSAGPSYTPLARANLTR